MNHFIENSQKALEMVLNVEPHMAQYQNIVAINAYGLLFKTTSTQ